MFLVDKRLQKTKLTLSLLAILHSQVIWPATELPANASADPSAISINDQLAVSADANSMIWPLLPGDSIDSLAALFYPKNQAMQQRFVTRTLQLNQQVGHNFDPAVRVNQVSLILIPDLKALGKNSGKIKAPSAKHRKKFKDPSGSPKLHLSYNLKDAGMFIVSDKMQADYDNLVKRNTILKLELEALNNKLVQLQQILAGLKAQAIDILNPTQPLSVPIAKPAAIVEPIIPLQEPAQRDTTKPAYNVLQVTSDHDKKIVSNPLYIWGLTILLLTIVALVIAWRAYSRRQAKDLYLAATGVFDPLKTSIFDQVDPVGYQDNVTKVDFSLTQNGLDESMSVVDLSEVEGLDYKEEGELILEQARIYVNIGRLDEATDLLRAQIKTMPNASLHHWLYLLDIYRDHQQKNEFLQYAKQLHETFNVMMPLWDNATLPIVIASSLEEFPHIMQKLTELWRSSELEEARVYIEELLMDNRESERAGFSMDVFQELVMLRDILVVRAKMAVSE